MVQVPLRALMAMIPAFLLGVLVMLAGSLLLGAYSSHVAYPAYMESLDLSEGSVGSVPTPDTPQARTVADMEALDTFYITGAVAWDRPLTLDGRRYYEVEIETGLGYTTFLARINKEASERLETGGRRLPIGRWLPLEAEDPDGVLDRSYGLDIKDHYADMEGDFGLVMTEREFRSRHPAWNRIQAASVLTVLVFYIIFYRVCSKKGWF